MTFVTTEGLLPSVYIETHWESKERVIPMEYTTIITLVVILCIIISVKK